jgi:hypothetical protein
VIVPSGHVPTRFTADVGLPASANREGTLVSVTLIADTGGSKPQGCPCRR